MPSFVRIKGSLHDDDHGCTSSEDGMKFDTAPEEPSTKGVVSQKFELLQDWNDRKAAVGRVFDNKGHVERKRLSSSVWTKESYSSIVDVAIDHPVLHKRHKRLVSFNYWESPGRLCGS